MIRQAKFGFVLLLWIVSLAQAGDSFPGQLTDWNGFERFDFEVEGKPLMVIRPNSIAPGTPWVWHGEFFGHKPAPDIALLKQGFHVVYATIPNQLGCPAAVAHWNKVYDYLTVKHQFCNKVGLIGLSRGGLYCYNWAIANPEKVACIYGDAPVCDFRSWPGGFGTGPGSPNDWRLVKTLWGFDSDSAARMYAGNPVDNLQPLAEAGVPLLHVFGDADEVVPWQENTGLVAKRYQELGGRIELIRKAGIKHHPHGLEDPAPIVEFLQQHCSSPLLKLHFDETTASRTKIESGLILHRLQSPYQNSPTEIKVLLPDSVVRSAASSSREAGRPPDKKLKVLFVLPVEKQHESRWGAGLQEIKALDLHNRYQLICVEPSLAQLPWYGDHPSDAGIRQESYLIHSVLPVLHWLYPEARHDRNGRLLIGFSKSGHGAWSLLLRNPKLFGRAAAWDAPLMLDKPNKYGSEAIFGTSQNFDQYAIPNLLKAFKSETSQPQALENGDAFSTELSNLSPTSQPELVRLIHAGFDNFRNDHQSIESLLNELAIPHVYHDGPQRKHHWSSGWIERLVQDLVAAEPGQ